MSFLYDGQGRRVGKITGLDLRYIYAGGQLVAEIDSSNTTIAQDIYRYYPGVDNPHSVKTVNGTYYYLSTIGTPGIAAVIDSTGKIKNRYRYNPWGGLEDSLETVANVLKFAGREYDPETHLYYNRARYYDPQIARFISEDPIGQSGGVYQYAYAENNPIGAADPSGAGLLILELEFHTSSSHSHMRLLLVMIAISAAATEASIRPRAHLSDLAKVTCGATRDTNVRGWDTFVLSSAPATLRVPSGPHDHASMAAFQDTWLTRRWELRVDVSSDSTGAPLATVGGPLPPTRLDVVECIDTVGRRPMRIVSYRQPSGELRGEYVVVADWPLAAGSWLRIGGVADDRDGQQLLEAIVATLALTKATTDSTLYHPTSRCEVTDRYYSSWSTKKLRYAPVRILMPRNAQSHASTTPPVEVLNWSGGNSTFSNINFMYRVLHTPGWQLSRPDGLGATWCQMQLNGGRLEFAADSVTPEHDFPIIEAKAYFALSPGVVLAIESHLRGDIPDGQEQLLAVLASIQRAEP